MFLTVNQRIDVVRGQFETMPVRYGIRRACFDAISTENAARIINIVDARVAFPGRNAVGIRVFGGFDINAIRRAGSGAEEASDALLEAGFVALQDVDPPIARLKMDRFVRIVLRNRLTKHISESDAEALHQGRERLANFS